MLKLKKTSRSRLGLGLAVLAVAGLAACSEGSPAKGGSDSDAGSISFRTIAAEGSGLTNYPDAQAGAKAAVEAINAEGGVNGKRIEFSFCNTKGDANTAMSCAREAAEDGVAAVVGRVDIFTTQSTPILEAAAIPDVGAVPIAEIDSVSPVSFPLHAGNYGAYAASPALFKAAGKEKMVVVQLDFATTAVQAKMVEEAAEAVGMESAGIILVPAQGVTDYSPYAQQIKDRGADSALVLLGPQALQGLYKSADALGVDAQFAASVFSFGESEAQAVGSPSDGVWALSPYGAPGDVSEEAISKFNKELTASGVSEDDIVLRRSAGLNAWLAVYAAAAVAETIDGEVTAESMTRALEESGKIDVEGVVNWHPSTLGSDDLGSFPRFPASSFQALTFKDGHMIPVKGPAIEDPMLPIR